MKIKQKLISNKGKTEENNFSTNNQKLAQSIASKDPEVCECARFGKRKLSWATWIKGFSKGKKGRFLDRKNIEFSHEHVIWDSSKDNIGFGTKGLYSEDVDSKDYKYDSKCYDGSLMRKAVSKVKDMGKYWLVGNNCQTYGAKVKNAYQELMSQSSEKN